MQQQTNISIMDIQIISAILQYICFRLAQNYCLSMNRVLSPPEFNFAYSTHDFLGKGFTSQVYRGRSKITGFPLAIKIIDINLLKEEDKKLVGSQIASMRKLRGKSPYLLNLIEVTQYRNNVYIVTEQCDFDLTRIIQNGPMLQRNAVELIQQIIKGYIPIAKNGIVHRDLKPANIFLKNNHVKIGDFGFAISLEECKTCHNVGSPLYMAPQCLLQTRYSSQSDIWALGIIYFQMLFGYAPFTAQNQNELINKLLNISITDILRSLPMSEKSYMFLKKTLSFKLQERMSLQQLQQFSFRTPRPVSSMLLSNPKFKNISNPQCQFQISSNVSNLTKQQKPQVISDTQKSQISKALNSQLLLCEYFLQLLKQLTSFNSNGRTRISGMIQSFILKIVSKIKSTSPDKSFKAPNIQQFWSSSEFQRVFSSVINFELKLRECFEHNPISINDCSNNVYKELRQQIMNTITSLFVDSNSKSSPSLSSNDRKFLLDTLVSGYQLIRLASVEDIMYFNKHSNINQVLDNIRIGPKVQ